MENKDDYKDGYKHRPSKDIKYRLRHDQKHKNKHKDERRSRKKDDGGRKARAMVGASDVDSISAYSSSSSSSSKDEGDQRKDECIQELERVELLRGRWLLRHGS
jgi:hypothetical protein